MMVTFIAKRIEEAADKSSVSGKEKYNAYFVNTKIYAKYKADVDAILMIDGYGEVIA